YLLPPIAPIPRHLISKDSLQRHHFLNIDPSDTESYFCWPQSRSPDPIESPIRALELLAGNSELLEKLNHTVNYDGDAETTRARVQVGDNVQVVFVWQDVSEESASMGGSRESGWRFHDVKRFTAPSQESSLKPQVDDSEQVSCEGVSRPSSPSSDVYWNSYGRISAGDSPELPRTARLPTSAQDSAEDAYWNSYSMPDMSGFVYETQGLDQELLYAYGRDNESYTVERGLETHYDEFTDVHHEETRAVVFEGDGHVDQRRILSAYEPGRYTMEAVEKVESHAARLTRALLPLLSLQEYIEKNPPQEGDPSPDSSVDDRDTTGATHSPLPLSREDGVVVALEKAAPSTNPSLSAAPLDEVETAVADSVRGLYKLWISSKTSPIGHVSQDAGHLRKMFLSLVENALPCGD
ncbi:uncharacterized protein EI90DRAFT_3051201, partial [Cantharellus anzutake]|uniref:uncharacterized protein n=1 Tax=Cantharellus anzutake TaxID=1750568 RepID=UPI001903BD6A